MAKKLTFEASAHIQTLIGRELFRRSETALVELVKNAYDSGATLAEVSIRPSTVRVPGSVEVRDNGEGMSETELERLFMVAGYSQRAEQISSAHRVPTGEKGVGRFASDRLGKKLVVLTKKKDQERGLRVEIDWRLFENRRKKFNDVSVYAEPVDVPGIALDESGTILEISDLRDTWTKVRVESARRLLTELLDPFEPPTDFKIVFRHGSEKLVSVTVSPEKVRGADIELHFWVSKSGTIKRRRGGRLFPKPGRREEASSSADSTDLARLSGIRGRFFYYLQRPTRELTQGLQPAARLYRDGFHVEPVGLGSGDWLGVAAKKAARAGHAHVLPSRFFGFVSISRRDHADLRDTTSREALLDTGPALAFFTLLREQVRYLEDAIRTKVTEPRWERSKEEQAETFQRARLDTLSMLSAGIAHELRQPLQTIRSEAENIGRRLSQLGIDDGDIRESQQQIDDDIERIDGDIRLISAIASGDHNEIAEFDVAEAVRTHTQAFAKKFASKGVAFSIKVPLHQTGALNKATLVMVLANLLSNASDAVLENRGRRRKNIVVSLTGGLGEHVLEVSDTGGGIPPEVRDKIFKSFVSRKTGGMGVGLYHCYGLVTAQGGEISVTSREGVGTQFTVTLPDSGVH